MPQPKFRQVSVCILRPGGQDQKGKFREQPKIPRLKMTEAGPNAGTRVKGSMPREETSRVRLSPAQGDSTLKLDSAQVRNSERPMSWAGTKSVGANSPGLFMARLGTPGSQEALEGRERKSGVQRRLSGFHHAQCQFYYSFHWTD